MKLGNTYHTAVGDFVNLGLKGLDRYEFNGNIAVTHDITEGGLPEFEKADCIYTEPCWRPGYEKFAKIAGVKPKVSYNDYLKMNALVARNLGKPAFILSGKAMLKALDADDVVDIYILQHKVWAYMNIFNSDRKEIEGCKSNEDVIESLSKKYKTILDYNAGYGNICSHVANGGGYFICSDLCSTAIEYIARKYMNYK